MSYLNPLLEKNITVDIVIFFNLQENYFLEINMNKPDAAEITKNNICSRCGQIVYVIWVYGHSQCSDCGYNIDEYCRGESSENYIKPEIENKENS